MGRVRHAGVVAQVRACAAAAGTAARHAGGEVNCAAQWRRGGADWVRQGTGRVLGVMMAYWHARERPLAIVRQTGQLGIRQTSAVG